MLHKSRTLMANEEKASFLNTQNGMNKQDKGSRRFTVFIGHFKRRSKSADQSNKELFHNANNLRNNLIGNKPNTSSYQPFFTGFHTARTNRHSSEHENQYSGNPLWASLNLPGEYNFDFDSIMSTSAHETACSSNSHQVGLQMDRKPRPASFHPASQILTHHHNPHFYQTRIFSSAIEEASCKAFSPYPYCHHNNSHYMQSSKQNKISSNMIMYDSVYDYPPTLSPYPCPIYIPPSEDITPTNENVNPCLSNSRARIQPTSVDFHRIRKMHSSMKQFFSFSGNKKDNLPKKSIANHVLGKERDVINPSFFDCDNSNNNHSVPSTGNLSSRLSINSSNNINFKGTVLRSFSCTPKSICDNKHRVKSQVLKTQNVSLNATTATTFTITTKTNTTTNNDNICDRRTKTKNDPTMCRIDTRSRLHAYCSRTKPTNGYESSCSSVYSRNSNHANYKFSIVKSPSTCQVTTCHNVPKLSSKTMQKGSDRPVSLTNCKFMNNTVKRKSTASTANGTSTTTITTTNTTINNIVDSNITSALNTTKTSATTSQVPCMINNSDYYIDVNHSTPHNTLTNENKVYPSFADRKMVNKKMEDPLLLSVSQSFNGDNDDKAEFLYTTSLLDYLSSTANVSFNQSTMNKLNSNNNGSLPLNVATTGNSINHFLYFLPDSKVIDNDQVMSMKSYDMCSTMKQPSINTACTQNPNGQTTVSMKFPEQSSLSHDITRTELFCNLPELHCSRLSQAYVRNENVKYDHFGKMDENTNHFDSRNVLTCLRNSCRKQTSATHPHFHSVQYSVGVLRPPRPPLRTTSLARDSESVRSNANNNNNTSYSSCSSPTRTPTCSKQDSNNQAYSSSLCGSSNQNRYSYCKPLYNLNVTADKLTDEEVSNLNTENDLVWWSHLLPYKPSNLPSNLADRLRQRNSLVLSRSSPTARLSNSSLPTAFPYNCSSQINNNKVNNNLPNLMIHSMYEQSDSGYNGLRSEGSSSLYCARNKDISEPRTRYSRPLSVHTDYSHCNNNNNNSSFYLPSLTHLSAKINSESITHLSLSSASSQKQQTPTRPSSLSLTSSFTNVISKATSFNTTDTLSEPPVSCEHSLQTNICNIIPDYLLKPYTSTDSPLLGQYCRLLLLRTNDNINRIDTYTNNSPNTALNEHSAKLTPTAETPV